MADNFFGFNTAFGASNLDDGLDDCVLDDEEYGEEEKYDALNDETFGSEATMGDWEQDHEKLAEITESTRVHHNVSNTTNINNKSFPQNGPDLDIDVEDNLSHLVLDEKDGITSRPGVWDSPTLSSLAPPRPMQLPKPPLVSTLKNACTVEELERNLIANRIDPILQQQQKQFLQRQLQQNAGRQTPNQAQHQLPLNGLPHPQRFPPGLPPGPLPPNVRLPHAPFLSKFCLQPNQSGNILRYPLPPHLMMAHGVQRQPFHNNFPMGNFHNMKQQQNNSNMVNLPFIRPDRPMLPFFANNMPHQHPPHPNFMNQRNNQNRHQNDQPFFKNNQPYHQQNRGYNMHKDVNGMNHHHTVGDKYDEYAGLMSSREKQWLVNIQLLQLNTNQPYIDDYYYTVFSDRQNKKNESKNKLDKKQNNNGYHKDSRDRDQPTFTRSPYAPAQFENSLGKLQYSSVTAPRKIIDMDIVANSEKQEALPPPPKDTKKTRQLLLEIERLYLLQLKLEDINNPLALLSEQQALAAQQQQEGAEVVEPKEPKKTVPELCNLILTSLLQLIKDDKFISMLSIRKGKILLLRFIPYLSVTEYTNQLQELWANLLRGLAIIGRRDSNLLTNFYSEFRRWLQTAEHFSTLLCLARAFTETSFNMKNNSLSFAVTNKFGVSVLASMLEQAEELYPSDEEQRREWSAFIKAMVDACGAKVPTASPCEPIAANTLNQHLNRIHGLTLDRFEPLENLLTDVNSAR